MKSIKCILLISTCLLFFKESQAEIDLTFDASSLSFSNPTLHTHHTPVELKPISNFKGIKFATTCFLPNCIDDKGFGFNLDTIVLCHEEGYDLTLCPAKKSPFEYCPHDKKYFKLCKCNTEFKYTDSSCKTQFPNSNLGSERCDFDSIDYGNSCVCDTVKYLYTSANCNGNESLSGEICKSSNGITYASKCICTPTAGKCNGYNLASNSCSGKYVTGESCHDGCTTKWRCKDSCNYKGSLSSCPIGYVCIFEECSGKYYISGCAVRYINLEQPSCKWYLCWMKQP